MIRSIALLTFVVRDYDEAIAFFIDALRFTLIEDTPLDEGKRWVVVAPPASQGASLLLAKAATPEQLAHIGNQTGGPRVLVPPHQRLLGRLPLYAITRRPLRRGATRRTLRPGGGVL